MNIESIVTDEAKKIIQKKLLEVERMHNVRILLAVESGSRAWGFPSTDSDYDVRFIYARSKEDYLSIRPYRDVIETDILHDRLLTVPLDLNGWDIRKALQLGLKSNAVLVEWLQSPIKYVFNKNVTADVLNFAQEAADLESIKDHYYRLAMNIWKQIEENPTTVKLKLYCYVLRPVLALQWVRQFNNIPPMDMSSLLKGLVKEEKLAKEIFELIILKATAKEGDLIVRNSIIDSFIQSLLIEQQNMPKNSINNENYIEADKLFIKIIGF